MKVISVITEPEVVDKILQHITQRRTGPVRGPRTTGGSCRAVTGNIDMMPTIMDLAGILGTFTYLY